MHCFTARKLEQRTREIQIAINVSNNKCRICVGMDDLCARFHSGVKIQNDDIGIMMREMVVVVVILDFRACQSYIN